jgi:hypothetical protein
MYCAYKGDLTQPTNTQTEGYNEVQQTNKQTHKHDALRVRHGPKHAFERFEIALLETDPHFVGGVTFVAQTLGQHITADPLATEQSRVQRRHCRHCKHG